MVLGAIIGGIATGLLGGLSSSSQASAQNAAQDRLDSYNQKLWDFNWEQDNRNRDFQIRQNAAQRTNLANERAYTLQTQIRDFQYSSMMDTAKYNAELQAYKKSNEIFSNQLRLNDAGLSLSLAQQDQWMREQELGYQFKSADLGLQLQASLNNYTQAMFSEQLTKQAASQDFKRTNLFSQQNRDLAILGAKQEYDFITKSGALRTQLTTDQANSEFALTSMLAKQQTALTERQAKESFKVATDNAREQFGRQVINTRAEQEETAIGLSREKELASVEAMQKQGSAQAGQAGRSTAKLAQALGFIAGINQAALSDRILFGEAGASRKIADAGLAMQQTGRVAMTEANQRIEDALFNEFRTISSASLRRDQTIQSAQLGNMLDNMQAGLRLKTTTDQANLGDFQTRYEASQRLSQINSLSDLRIAKAESDKQFAQDSNAIATTGILASLVSARISNEFTTKSLKAEKYMADLNAYANKMLPPLEPLQRPAPLLLPEPIILDPPELIKPPKPVAGATVSPVGAFLGGAAGGFGSAIGAGIDALSKKK